MIIDLFVFCIPGKRAVEEFIEEFGDSLEISGGDQVHLVTLVKTKVFNERKRHREAASKKLQELSL